DPRMVHRPRHRGDRLDPATRHPRLRMVRGVGCPRFRRSVADHRGIARYRDGAGTEPPLDGARLTSAGPETRARISASLALILASHTGARIAVGELLDALGDHGFGLLILVPALLNAIPGPHIPGFSLPFAIALIVLGAQLALGWSSPWVPRRVR